MPQVIVSGMNASRQESSGQLKNVDKFPAVCPICRHNIAADNIFQEFACEDWLELFFRCSNIECLRSFIAFYSLDSSNTADETAQVFNLKVSFPVLPIERPVTSQIASISPSFAAIYAQAQAAEDQGLDELAGIGFRRSLEILLKDYCVSIAKTPEDAYKVGKMPHHEFLRKYSKGDRPSKTILLLEWIGEDGFDYERRWVGENVLKLKQAISVIENVISLSMDVDAAHRANL
jgi:hypothetical protein